MGVDPWGKLRKLDPGCCRGTRLAIWEVEVREGGTSALAAALVLADSGDLMGERLVNVGARLMTLFGFNGAGSVYW